MLSAIRNFFITLLSALILLGLVGYMITDVALSVLDPDRTPASQPSESEGESEDTNDTPDEPNGPSLPSTDESFTILLIGHDYQPGVFEDYDRTDEPNPTGFPLPERKVSADMLVVIRVDQSTKTTLFCNIPTNARITNMGFPTTLGALYGEYGAAYLAEKVTSLIGIPVDYYVSVGISGLTSLIDEIGGINYRIPQAMEYYDEVEDYRISLSPGLQKLDGAKTLQLLRFNGYGDDGTTRRNTAIAVLKTIITKISEDRDYYKNALSIYSIMEQYVETNFTQAEIARKLDLMFLYPEMTPESKQYPGQTVIEEIPLVPDVPESGAPNDPNVPENPDDSDDPSNPIDPENPGNPDSPTEPTVEIIYWYELDIAQGRALFSSYKYKG